MTAVTDNRELQPKAADTAVIIWRADDEHQAAKARDWVSTQPGLIPESSGLCPTEFGPPLYYAASFGPLSGFVFFAWGEEGMEDVDSRNLDRFASGFLCETELWIGIADDIIQIEDIMREKRLVA